MLDFDRRLSAGPLALGRCCFSSPTESSGTFSIPLLQHSRCQPQYADYNLWCTVDTRLYIVCVGRSIFEVCLDEASRLVGSCNEIAAWNARSQTSVSEEYMHSVFLTAGCVEERESVCVWGVREDPSYLFRGQV